LGQFFTDLKNHILFVHTLVISPGTVILPTVPGIDHDTANPQGELTGNGARRNLAVDLDAVIGFGGDPTILVLSVDIDDNPEGVFQGEDLIRLKGFDVHHHAHQILIMLAGPRIA